jgi:hypothetical protein
MRLLTTKNTLLFLLYGYSRQRPPLLSLLYGYSQQRTPFYLSYTATHNKEHPLISPIRLLTTKNTLLSLL